MDKIWMNNLNFIIYGENAWRIRNIGETDDGKSTLTYDIHGKTVLEAKRDIHNIINLTRAPLRLTVIHGYHSGTALKNMLSTETFYGRLENRYCPAHNPGETVMYFAA